MKETCNYPQAGNASRVIGKGRSDPPRRSWQLWPRTCEHIAQIMNKRNLSDLWNPGILS